MTVISSQLVVYQHRHRPRLPHTLFRGLGLYLKLSYKGNAKCHYALQKRVVHEFLCKVAILVWNKKLRVMHSVWLAVNDLKMQAEVQ